MLERKHISEVSWDNRDVTGGKKGKKKTTKKHPKTPTSQFSPQFFAAIKPKKFRSCFIEPAGIIF